MVEIAEEATDERSGGTARANPISCLIRSVLLLMVN
jgi:hypothetical protein